MGDQKYAFSVNHIREVLLTKKLTKLPQMPEYIQGIINLRGLVVPVLDLKRKFALGETTIGSDTGIIVVEIPKQGESGDDDAFTYVGVFADSIEKVISIDKTNIEPPPQIGNATLSQYITGVGKVDDEFVIILDILCIMTAEELASIREIDAPAAT
jgi:purine-binding chemotaxis protein CheW